MMPAWCIKYPSIHMHLNSYYLFKDIVVNYVLVYVWASFIVKWQFVSTSSWCSLHIISIIYSQSEANDRFLCPRLVSWLLHMNHHGLGCSLRGALEVSATGEQTHPFFPATMGGCGQDPAPRRAWSCGRVPGGAQMDITVWGLLLPNRDGAVPQPASRSLVCSMLAKIKWNADTVESWLGHKVVFVRAASLLHPVSLQHNFPPLPNANWKTAMDLWTSGGNSTPFLLLHCILIEKETPWQHQSLDIVQAPHASLIWVLLSQGRQPTGGLVQPQGLPSNWNEASWGDGSLKAAASPDLPSGQVYSPLRQAPPWHHSFHSYPDQGPVSALGDGQPWSLFLTHPGSSLQGCG